MRQPVKTVRLKLGHRNLVDIYKNLLYNIYTMGENNNKPNGKGSLTHWPQLYLSFTLGQTLKMEKYSRRRFLKQSKLKNEVNRTIIFRRWVPRFFAVDFY